MITYTVVTQRRDSMATAHLPAGVRESDSLSALSCYRAHVFILRREFIIAQHRVST